jgi:hypothetical protein
MVPISAEFSTILSEVLRGFTQPRHENARIAPQLGQDRSYRILFLFISHSIIRCSIVCFPVALK